MLVEVRIKADLHLGHVIKITLNNETGEVRFTQSKELLWERNYQPFNLVPYHFMMEHPFELSLLKDLSNVLLETGVLYGCVLNYSKDIGYVHVTFHSNPIILHNLAKITLEARQEILDKVEQIWKDKKHKPELYSFLRKIYPNCYCGKVLDPDLNQRCQDCTGYICTCGKCHCTEGKSFNHNS